MAYLDTSTPRSRATAIAGVGALHLALAAVLVTGLAVKFQRAPERPVEGIQLPPAPPPPMPEAQPSHAAQAPKPTAAPQPQEPLPTNSGVTVASLPTAEILSDTPTVADPIPPVAPMPTPSATFAPKGALPLGDTSRWITADDYPARALRAQQAGLVGYHVAIGSDGRVTACEVTASSRNAELDAATCRLIKQRARFAPATDAAGAHVGGTFSGSVRWQIPD